MIIKQFNETKGTAEEAFQHPLVVQSLQIDFSEGGVLGTEIAEERN